MFERWRTRFDDKNRDRTPKHLAKRAREIREEFLISSKVGVWKEICRTIEWMDPDYKAELEEILRLYAEQNE